MARENVNINTKQFHLRIPQETYDEIKRRAAAMSLSVSDYVVFVTTSFDIKEVERKIDEINARLDAISEATTS